MMKKFNEFINESKGNFDFFEVSDWLENATDWSYVEHEGQK